MKTTQSHVYCITNLTNQKKYIGKTKDPKRRWRMHKSKQGNSNILYKAINKYGIDNFEFLILKTFETEKEAYECEKLMIISLNTKTPNGYNITDGGIGIQGLPKTKEHILKVAKAHTGMKRSKETCQRISESKKGKCPKHSMDALKIAWEKNKGKKLSEERKKKLLEGRRAYDERQKLCKT